jgi:hypothetical protein
MLQVSSIMSVWNSARVFYQSVPYPQSTTDSSSHSIPSSISTTFLVCHHPIYHLMFSVVNLTLYTWSCYCCPAIPLLAQLYGFPEASPQSISVSRPSLAVPSAAVIEDVTPGNTNIPLIPANGQCKTDPWF